MAATPYYSINFCADAEAPRHSATPVFFFRFLFYRHGNLQAPLSLAMPLPVELEYTWQVSQALFNTEDLRDYLSRGRRLSPEALDNITEQLGIYAFELADDPFFAAPPVVPLQLCVYPTVDDLAPRALSAAVTLPEVSLKEDGKTCCAICLENLIGAAASLPCSHVYHRSCIVEWLKRKTSCPICRYRMPSEDQFT